MIVADEERDHQKAKDLENLALVELRCAYEKISEHIKKTALNHEGINQALTQFEEYERNDGSVEYSGGPVSGRHGSIMRALICLADLPEKKHKEFASSIGKGHAAGEIIYWTFAPNYSKMEEELKYIDRIKLTKLWFSWSKLGFFYLLYRDYEKMSEAEIKKKKYFNAMGLKMSFDELNDIMSYKTDQKRYLREFDVPTYKNHMQRLHSFAKEYLHKKDMVPATEAPTLSWSITESVYDGFYQSFRDKIAEIDTRLAILQEAEDNYYITAKYLLELANRAYELFKSSEVEERRQLIKLVLSNLRVEGKSVRYEAIKPFDTLLNYADRQAWLPRLDSNQGP